jgi:hypothetical protein
VLGKGSIFHIKYGYECAQLGKHECIVLYAKVAATASASYTAEIFCVSLNVVSFFFSLFFYLQGKSVASTSEMEAAVYAETSLPTYKIT